MTDGEKDFISIIAHALNGKDRPAIDKDTENEVISLAAIHNLLPLVYDCMSRNELYANPKVKDAAIRQAVLQGMKTQKFLRVYDELKKSGVVALCVKGLVLRSIYPEPDFRPSGDEDIIVRKNDFEKLKAVFLKNGFENKKENESEISFFDKTVGLKIEASCVPFSESGKTAKTMNSFFNGCFDDYVEIKTDDFCVYSLSYTEHLLYILCHAFKHFFRSGFGIRQVCDIGLFTEKFCRQINFDLVFDCLKKINAYEFSLCLYSIAYEYLGFDKSKVTASIPEPTVKTQNLLEDIIDAGVYGKSSFTRVHSGSVTLSAVDGEKGRLSSFFTAVFPKAKDLSDRYTVLKKRPYLLPAVWLKRLFDFSFKLTKGSCSDSDTFGSVQTANSRLALLTEYQIIGKEKNTDDFSDTSLNEEEFEAAMAKKFDEEKNVVLRVTGDSMAPFLLNKRDSVVLSKIKEKPRVGDIVLYERSKGNYVLHRVVKIKNDEFFMSGDAQIDIEGPIESQQLSAVCIRALRKGKLIGKHNPIWIIFSVIWVHIRKNRPTLSALWYKLKMR